MDFASGASALQAGAYKLRDYCRIVTPRWGMRNDSWQHSPPRGKSKTAVAQKHTEGRMREDLWPLAVSRLPGPEARKRDKPDDRRMATARRMKWP